MGLPAGPLRPFNPALPFVPRGPVGPCGPACIPPPFLSALATSHPAPDARTPRCASTLVLSTVRSFGHRLQQTGRARDCNRQGEL
eukprot:3274151-Rhodomonas_salina.2